MRTCIYIYMHNITNDNNNNSNKSSGCFHHPHPSKLSQFLPATPAILRFWPLMPEPPPAVKSDRRGSPARTRRACAWWLAGGNSHSEISPGRVGNSPNFRGKPLPSGNLKELLKMIRFYFIYLLDMMIFHRYLVYQRNYFTRGYVSLPGDKLSIPQSSPFL